MILFNKNYNVLFTYKMSSSQIYRKKYLKHIFETLYCYTVNITSLIVNEKPFCKFIKTEKRQINLLF